jgi:hypothetical protein
MRSRRLWGGAFSEVDPHQGRRTGDCAQSDCVQHESGEDHETRGSYRSLKVKANHEGWAGCGVLGLKSWGLIPSEAGSQ